MSRRRLALLIIVSSALHLRADAQIARGMDETQRTDLGGKNFILGVVFGPDGLPLHVRIPIRLSSLTQREVMGRTDDDGKFTFSGLPNGFYTLSIEGTDEYQTAAQTVTIDLNRTMPPQSFSISFRLQAKRRTGERPGVVNADTAGVSKKALDHYRKAASLASAGDIKGAIVELEAALKEYPNFPGALTELGIQQLKTGDLADADSNFEKALVLQPDHFEALVNRGIGLFRQNKMTDAEGFLRNSVEVKPSSDIAHFYLGRTLLRRDQLDDAEKELKTALSLSNGSLFEVHRMLTQVYIQRDDFANALSSLDNYLAANPKASDIDALHKTHQQLEQALASTKARQKP